jgi:hypothetical protein
MKCLALVLLALPACATHPEFAWDELVLGAHGYAGFRFPARHGDAARIAAGYYPVLITADGAPCRGARLYAEPTHLLGAWVPTFAVKEWGVSEVDLPPELPGTIKTDARGIAWWKPKPHERAWTFTASFGGRHERLHWSSSAYGGYPALEAQTRHSLTLAVIDLPPLVKWRIRVEPTQRICDPALPIFIASYGTSAWMRLEGRGPEYLIPDYPFELEGRDRAAFVMWAGFDRGQAISTGAGPATEYLLPLGETGCIELELRDEHGRVVRSARAVYLEEVGADRSGMSMVARDGRVHFTGVPIGRTWIATARVLDGEVPVSMELAGPRAQDETVRNTLDAARESVLVHGFITDADGSPAASLELILSSQGTGLGDVAVRTDASGAFSVRLPKRLLASQERLHLHAAIPDLLAPRWLSILTTDLTAMPLRLRFPPSDDDIFAQGRIVDEAGVPHEGATILGDVRSRVFGSVFQLDEPWPRSEVMTVWAADFWHHPAHHEQLIRGQREVQLRVAHGARISARLHPDHLAAFRGWRVSPDLADPVNRVSPQFDWGPCQSGWFEIGPIPADATEVVLDFGDAGTARLTDLTLAPGVVFHYPRLVKPTLRSSVTENYRQ